MDVSTLRQNIVRWTRQRAALEDSLLGFRGPLVKGWLHERATSCRRGRCKCMRGEKHGPFLYASLKIGSKVVQRYVGKTGDEGLVKRIREYGTFREGIHELRKVQRLLEEGWRRLERQLMKPVSR